MVALPQINPPQATEVGSYFVANYPPFSVWRPEHVPDYLAALDRPQAKPAPLGLYLHIPFCRKRCHFCYFRVYTDKNAGDVDVYLNALATEIELYADRPALAGRSFEFVYFGGGTPSFLSNDQLRRLIERINRRWTWSDAREVTFECEPGTLKQSKLQTIREIGVTRLSLGVEHFDDAVLETNGRAHHSKEIAQAWEWIREVGFPQVNVDLIAGMVGDDEGKWKTTVEKTLTLRPDSVTIYQMEVPHNTTLAREAKAEHHAPPVPNWATKRARVDYAFRQFEAAGYDVSSGYTLIDPKSHAGFVYRDSLWHGADLIGTGVASFGHLSGVHYQNVDQWGDYVATLERGELPLARALPVSRDQLLIREMILQLKTGRIQRGYFRDKFGVDVADRFQRELEGLQCEALADCEGDEIRLTRPGLLRVDELLHRFFEKPYRDVRYT